MAKKTKIEMCRNRGEIEAGIIEGVKEVLYAVKAQKKGEPLYQKEYDVVRKAVEKDLVVEMADIFIENLWEPKDADKLVRETTEKAITEFKSECKAQAKGAPGQKALAQAEKARASAKTSAKSVAKPEPKKGALRDAPVKVGAKPATVPVQKSSVQKVMKGRKKDDF